MNIGDIRQTILYNIDNIQDLKNLCHVDHWFNQLCSTKSFWIHWYNKKGILFPDSGYTSASDWIKEYEEIVVYVKKTNDIIDDLIYGNKNLSYVANIKIDMGLALGIEEYDEELKKLLVVAKNENVKIRIKHDKDGFNILYMPKNKNYTMFFPNINRKTIFKYIFDLLFEGYRFNKL